MALYGVPRAYFVAGDVREREQAGVERIAGLLETDADGISMKAVACGEPPTWARVRR